jgi:Flp pilus assembly protein TadG
MIRRGTLVAGREARKDSLARDRIGATALEFAIVALPFLLVMLTILQMGLFYMTQSALDAGVNTTANNLRNMFSSTTPQTLPSATMLKASVVTNAGGLIYNNSGLAVEIRQMSSLNGGTVAITDGTVDFGSAPVVTATVPPPLVLRAQSNVVTFAPGFKLVAVVESTAIVRRTQW